jgi:hypothetical protein
VGNIGSGRETDIEMYVAKGCRCNDCLREFQRVFENSRERERERVGQAFERVRGFENSRERERVCVCVVRI